MRIPVRRLRSVLVCMAFMTAATGARAEAIDSLSPELRARGGFCVFIGGMEDLAPAAALLDSGPWVIHWLDADETAVETARRVLQARRVYGRVTAERWDRDNLPYADNLANLIVVRDARSAVGRDELMRALAPGGSLVIAVGDGYRRLDKPRPAEMGEWTHPWHGPDGSPASTDTALGVPNAFQWISGPNFPLGGRKGSDQGILSAGGRVFSITQNVPENIGAEIPTGGANRFRLPDEAFHLVARDAFSGILLWSQPWEGPLAVPNHRWGHPAAAFAATAERIYAGRAEGVAVLDAASGRRLALWPMDDQPEALLLTGGRLVAQSPGGLTGFDADEGGRLWRYEAANPWGTLAGDGRAFCMVGTREEDGRWRHEIVGIDLDAGREVWRRQVESEFGPGQSLRMRPFFAGAGVVTLVERASLRILSQEDGRDLWRHESEAMGRMGSSDARHAGHFHADGAMWVREKRASGGRSAEEPWSVRDPLSGKVLREVVATGAQGVTSNVNKISCQRLTATGRFLIDGRLSTMWDLGTGERSGFKFGRGSCLLGIVPANGLAYTPPNACGCLDEQFRGNLALVRTADEGLHTVEPGPMERGPAYGVALESDDARGVSAWPMYRGDGLRRAYLDAHVPVEPALRWETALEAVGDDRDREWRLHLGRPFTPPVVAGGLALLAEPQAHQVIALEQATGAERWRFTAGGRVTTPPTLHGGLALFAAHDGYVYALRASDGALAWRRRAAPSDRRIIVYGQLESAWPIPGGVLVHEGLALVAGGRAVDADGGLVVHAFDPQTGAARWSRRVTGGQYGVCDLLVSDGAHVHLMDNRLDAQTGEMSPQPFGYHGHVRGGAISERGGVTLYFPDSVRYLRAGKAGFFQTAWTRVDMALRKGQTTWSWGDVEGELLAIAPDAVYAWQIDADDLYGRPATKGGGQVLARPLDGDGTAWSYALPAPAQVEAMFATGDAVFIAGPADRGEPDGAGFLRVLAREDGRELARASLPVAPVHDGMAAADGAIFAVLRDGRVVRLGGK